MSERPWLHALADAVGVMPFYHDVAGNEHRLDDAAAQALLAAMGYAVETEDSAREELAGLERAAAARIVPPVSVIPAAASAPVLRLRLPGEAEGGCRCRVDVTTESGDLASFEGDVTGSDAAIALDGLAHGYHTARVQLEHAGRTWTDEGELIVTPARCWTVADALGGRRGFGVWTNLYTIRSDGNWGIGDFADLRRLVELAAAHGAAFVGVNPLHALRNTPPDISPYSPVSRLFRSIAYISVPDVPELAESDEARALVASAEVQAQLAELRGADVIDYDRVRALKERVLRLLFDTFAARHRGRDSERGRAFAAYVEGEGRALDEFVTFLGLDRHLARDGQPVYWREWPEEYRDYRSAAVQRFHDDHGDELDWYRWLQFEADRQLGRAAEAAREAGMAIGLYQDLAVGTSDGGSDVWSFQHLFDRGVTVGAPPDEYAVEGQDWGLPPLDPNRMREDRYRYWIRLLRAAFRHAGALRIDHAMGLARLYWIPPGVGATGGAYVRYPAEDLLGILALESHRSRAVVIAEDLGTVPEGFEVLLGRWGILSSRLLWFERGEGGGFRPQSAYLARALVTTTTHDHAPLAAWLGAHDVETRRRIGLISGEEADDAVRARERERAALYERLREAGLLADSAADLPYDVVMPAVYAFLAATPCELVGVSLDDLSGETEPVNVPGVGPERYPVWARRMRRTLDEIARDPAADRTFAAADPAADPA